MKKLTAILFSIIIGVLIYCNPFSTLSSNILIALIITNATYKSINEQFKNK